MRYDRKIKMLSIIALVLAITGMSLGFAAFSSTLTISSSATVTPNSDDFKITWHSDENDLFSTSITAVGINGCSGSPAIISNDNNLSISNIHASFTKPGQTIAYNFFATNSGKYTVYGDTMSQANVSGTEQQIYCSIPEGSNATLELVEAACDDISVHLGAGSNSIINSELPFGKLTNFYLFSDNTIPVVLLIKYAEDGDMADGPFNVQFGDISITYTSVPNK